MESPKKPAEDTRNVELEKANRAKMFNNTVESLKFRVLGSDALSEDTKAEILKALDVTVNDFMSDTLDRSKSYEVVPSMEKKVQVFLLYRVRTEVLEKLQDEQQMKALFGLLKGFMVGDRK